MGNPSMQFHNALVARLASVNVRDEVPEEADYPYTSIEDEDLNHDDSHDARCWVGNFTIEVHDLVAHGRTRVKAAMDSIDTLLHGQHVAVSALMDDYKVNWIRYQSSGTARSGDDTKFTGAIVFEVSLEAT